MIKYVNNSGAPDAFFRAVVNDPYSRGGSDFSATSLLQPPRAFILLETNDVEVDVSTRVAILLGQGTHSILERAKKEGDIIETRFFKDFTVDGVKYSVSAQIDHYDGETRALSDWKTTKAFSFHKKAGPKAEWEFQLNLGALLMKAGAPTGLGQYDETLSTDIKTLQIIGLLKDWDHNKARTEAGYPPQPVAVRKIKKWTDEETVRYTEERIRDIVKARAELPKCSSKETWGGNRCGQWCDAASVCSQYQESKKTGLIAPKGEL